jgi:hypothetical protein
MVAAMYSMAAAAVVLPATVACGWWCVHCPINLLRSCRAFAVWSLPHGLWWGTSVALVIVVRGSLPALQVDGQAAVACFIALVAWWSELCLGRCGVSERRCCCCCS